jgi:hypothetical protein
MMLTNAIRHPSAGNADPVEAQPAPTPGLRSEFREPTDLRARGLVKMRNAVWPRFGQGRNFRRTSTKIIDIVFWAGI